MKRGNEGHICSFSSVTYDILITRGNILDLVLSSDLNMVNDLEVQCPIANSDHHVLRWNISIRLEQNTDRTARVETFDYEKGQYQNIISDLQEVDWNNAFSNHNVNDCWNIFSSKLLETRNKFVPRKNPSNHKRSPFINNDILRKIRKRNRLWTAFKNYPNITKELKYKRARNDVTLSIKTAKKNYEAKIVNKIKTDSKQFYAYVNRKKVCKNKIGPLSEGSGKLTQDSQEMAKILNSYFTTVFTLETDKIEDHIGDIRDDMNSLTLNTVDITDEKIEKALQGLKRNKKEGVDGIISTLLIESKAGVILPLKLLYNKSLITGEIPLNWKQANVTPIFKKGSKKDPGNYRPISPTSQVCKLMEKILKIEIVKFLESNDKLSDSQHGFRNKRSCLTNLLDFTENLLNLNDKNEPIDILFFDLQKAFDKVPHKRLLYQIKKIGITGDLLKWNLVKSFL